MSGIVYTRKVTDTAALSQPANVKVNEKVSPVYDTGRIAIARVMPATAEARNAKTCRGELWRITAQIPRSVMQLAAPSSNARKNGAPLNTMKLTGAVNLRSWKSGSIQIAEMPAPNKSDARQNLIRSKVSCAPGVRVFVRSFLGTI